MLPTLKNLEKLIKSIGVGDKPSCSIYSCEADGQMYYDVHLGDLGCFRLDMMHGNPYFMCFSDIYEGYEKMRLTQEKAFNTLYSIANPEVTNAPIDFKFLKSTRLLKDTKNTYIYYFDYMVHGFPTKFQILVESIGRCSIQIIQKSKNIETRIVLGSISTQKQLSKMFVTVTFEKSLFKTQ